jgi:predicted anti-sigma-YlaC factor YlaD
MKTISCKEAVNYILKKEERKLSLLQRMSLWRHLAICSLCRIFSVQNAMLNEAMKQRAGKALTLTEDEKEQIIQNVLDEKTN